MSGVELFHLLKIDSELSRLTVSIADTVVVAESGLFASGGPIDVGGNFRVKDWLDRRQREIYKNCGFKPTFPLLI